MGLISVLSLATAGLLSAALRCPLPAALLRGLSATLLSLVPLVALLWLSLLWRSPLRLVSRLSLSVTLPRLSLPLPLLRLPLPLPLLRLPLPLPLLRLSLPRLPAPAGLSAVASLVARLAAPLLPPGLPARQVVSAGLTGHVPFSDLRTAVRTLSHICE